MLNSRPGSKSNKLLIGGLASVLMVLALANLHRQATFTGEQASFLEPPSDISFIQSFPKVTPNPNDSVQVRLTSLDSIKLGDLLLTVDGQEVSSVEQFETTVNQTAHDTLLLSIEVFRLSETQTRTIAVQRGAIPDSVVSKLPMTVYAQNVPRGVASELAGLRRGDLVYRVNNDRFGGLDDFEAILDQAQGSGTTTYNIIRNNHRSTLPVNLATFDLELSVVFAFLSGLVFFGVGSFIGLSQPEVQGARLLGSAFICVGFVMAIALAHADQTSDLLSQLVNICFCGSLAFGLALWTDSKMYFPTERPEIIDRAWARRVPYAVAGFFFLMFSFVGFDVLSSGQFGQMLVVAMILSLTGLSVALPLVFKTEESKEFVKIRRLLAIVSTAACLVAAVMAYMLISSGDFNHLGYAGIPLTFIPLTYLYMAGRYQLLGMSLGLSRKIQYVITTSVWATILVLVLTKVLLFLPNLNLPVPHLRDGLSA
jgi:hypothetical protein